MRAALLRDFGTPLQCVDLPDPIPGPGEAVVRVLAAPVLSYMHEVFDGTRNYPLVLPLVPGCGPVGVIDSLGPDATRLARGQLVFCDPVVRSRDDAYAPDIMLHGLIAAGEGAQRLQRHFRHGAFSEKMLVALENVHPLEGLSADDAPRLTWLNTLLVPYGGLLAAELRAGQTVLINGATGHFGSAAAAVALAMGAECVVAAGRKTGLLQALKERLGPRIRPVAVTGDEAADTYAMKQAVGGTVDAMLDILSPITTFSPTRAALMALRPEGIAVLMGGVQADISFPYSHLMRSSITLRGKFMYPRTAPRTAAGLIRSGLLSLAPFSTTQFPLEKANEAVQYASQHGGAFEQTVLIP